MKKIQGIGQLEARFPVGDRARDQGYALNPLKSKTPEQVFTEIYKSNFWGGQDSVSGTGSDIIQTRTIRKEFTSVCREYRIASILDIPCGDFHWMQHFDFGHIDYTGADIVKEVIQRNAEKNGKNGVRFMNVNLLTDQLPTVDLIFCRDCLVHFSFEDIFRSLANVCESRSKFMLTTTFTGHRDNHDIATGEWRTLNLERAPFGFPPPLNVINEGCTEADGIFSDKSLGLWRLTDIRQALLSREALLSTP